MRKKLTVVRKPMQVKQEMIPHDETAWMQDGQHGESYVPVWDGKSCFGDGRYRKPPKGAA